MDSFCGELPEKSRLLSKNEKKEYIESLFGDENAIRNLSILAKSASGVQKTIEWIHAIEECPCCSIENVRYDNKIRTVASYYYSSRGGVLNLR